MTLPTALTGTNAPKTYTAYHIVTVFEKDTDRPQKFEVDRRFSEFEKLLTHVRSLPGQPIIPDLPKKRYFNQGEQVIELRRTELEKFLKVMLRSKEMRNDSAVRYFLTQQDGFESFLGNVGLYSWAYTSLQ